MAEYYSAELAQKINRGIRESWKKGNATGGKPPYGYKIKNKKFIIDEHEANVVNEIFMLYSQNYCMREIKDQLTAKGFYKPNGKRFTEKYITYILHNKRYIGIVEHHNEVYDNIFPRIISDDLWEAVNKRTESNKLAPNKKKDIYEYILSGKMLCGECKKHFIGVSSTSKTKAIHYYYQCVSRKNRDYPCSTKTIRKQVIEDLVIQLTTQILNNKNTINLIAEMLIDLINKDNKENSTIKMLEQQKEIAIKSSQNIIKAIEQGIITEMTKNRLRELEDEINRLKQEIYKEQQKLYLQITVDDVKKFLQKKVFKNTEDFAIRKMIVNTFIKNIIIYNDKIVIIFNYCNKKSGDDLDAENTLNIEEQIDSALKNQGCASTIPLSPPKKYCENYFSAVFLNIKKL